MAQGRSTQIISMIKWIRTSRLSTKNSLSIEEVPGRELLETVLLLLVERLEVRVEQRVLLLQVAHLRELKTFLQK